MVLLTDEQISELAEAMQDACQQWIDAGGLIAPLLLAKNSNCICPMGAMINNRFPTGRMVEQFLNIPAEAVWSFIIGFEAQENCWEEVFDYRMFKLGQLFRRQYCPHLITES